MSPRLQRRSGSSEGIGRPPINVATYRIESDAAKETWQAHLSVDERAMKLQDPELTQLSIHYEAKDRRGEALSVARGQRCRVDDALDVCSGH